MANVILRFQWNECGVPPDLPDLLEPASLVSVTDVSPTPIVDITVDDAVNGAVDVAVAIMLDAGWDHTATDPSDTPAAAEAVQLFNAVMGSMALVTQTISGVPVVLDWSSLNHEWTLEASLGTGEITFNLPTPPPGLTTITRKIVLAVKEDVVGTHLISSDAWPASVIWQENNTPPVFGDGANTKRLLSFYYDYTNVWGSYNASVYGP